LYRHLGDHTYIHIWLLSAHTKDIGPVITRTLRKMAEQGRATYDERKGKKHFKWRLLLNIPIKESKPAKKAVEAAGGPESSMGG
jgi:hypothetical protein